MSSRSVDSPELNMEYNDTNSTTFDIDKVLYKIKDIFGALSGKNSTTRNGYSLVIENDFVDGRLKSCDSDNSECHVPGMNSYGTFADAGEMQQCKSIKCKLEESLRSARDTKFKCEILFPCGTTSKIAQDVLRMSSQEPYGLRGCVLYVNLEEKNACKKVARVEMDSSTVATFELYLTLKEDNRGWCMLEKIYLTLKGCFKNSKWKSMPKILCSGFVLEKKKLYRMNQ